MRKRAERVDETRQRIVEAAVDLHGTVGPAATTIAAIAERAGVTRLTVYRHFADDEALFAACSAHWRSRQTLPDPAAWARITDPARRLHCGLADLYRFYRAGEPMLTRVYHDADALPGTLRRALEEEDRRRREVLLEPFGRAGRRRTALVGHATAFGTWRSLCVEHGLSDRDAVKAMSALILSATVRSGMHSRG